MGSRVSQLRYIITVCTQESINTILYRRELKEQARSTHSLEIY
jgi:hypothetical protein